MDDTQAAGFVLTAEEVAAAMIPNKAWNYPASEDGWVHAHDAVRLDMQDVSEALASCVAMLESGQALPAWVIPNLQKFWTKHCENVNHHHDNEETIFFPGLEALGVKMPPKMSSDHKTLLAELDVVTGMVTNVKPDLESFKALQARFEGQRAMMAEHLKEEEDVGLPLMRHNLTRKQVQPVEDKLVKTISPELLGWFLRPFKNDEERRRWMTDIAGIPGFVQSLIMLPAAKKFRNDVARLIMEVKAGERITPEPSGCLCF